MKARIPHKFVQYASQFTIESILISISNIAFDIYNNQDNLLKGFAGHRKYSVIENGKLINDEVLVVQTWLIDIIYKLVSLRINGYKEINISETFYLIHLYENYVNDNTGAKFKKKSPTKMDLFLQIFGFFGEQKRFQEQFKLFDEFSREKYILDVISEKEQLKKETGIDYLSEFYEQTGLKTDMYSAVLFSIFAYYSHFNPVIKSELIEDLFYIKTLSKNEICKMLERYSCSISELEKSEFKRQFLYIKPIIKLNDLYIASNPFLILSLFINSNYWVMRDKYNKATSNKQKFVNAFGKYFEEYLKEILVNCLPEGSFVKIQEVGENRADWHIKLDDIDFLLEQKSGLSILDIKQSEPNTNLMKEHILKNWGKAVKQLHITEKAFNLNNAIKIILVYEDYYKCECLEVLFDLNPELLKYDNKKFWLLTISEFEKLMVLYKNDSQLFFKIIKEKDMLETTASISGRDLDLIFKKYKLFKNDYITNFGIDDQYNNLLQTLRGID